MYSLQREGADIDPEVLEGRRMGDLDFPHIFLEGFGGILPASLLKAKNNRKIGTFKGPTFKLGPAHSHDRQHEYHILEKMTSEPETVLKKFRSRVRSFRETRKESRDE